MPREIATVPLYTLREKYERYKQGIKTGAISARRGLEVWNLVSGRNRVKPHFAETNIFNHVIIIVQSFTQLQDPLRD